MGCVYGMCMNIVFLSGFQGLRVYRRCAAGALVCGKDKKSE